MGISRFPIRPGVDLRNINSASPRGSNRPVPRFDGQCFNGVCVLCLAQSKEKSICPLGCFGARMDGRRSITEPVLLFRSHAQGTRQAIGNAIMIAKTATGLRISNPPA